MISPDLSAAIAAIHAVADGSRAYGYAAGYRAATAAIVAYLRRRSADRAEDYVDPSDPSRGLRRPTTALRSAAEEIEANAPTIPES
jgi:hypothetical protein